MSGDISTAPAHVDLLIVGCGLSGAVIAERCSQELGMKSLILDVRDHVREPPSSRAGRPRPHRRS